MLRVTLLIVGFVFLVWTAATSLTQVQSHERAVIRRFGRILDDKPQQGLHIGMPWGIDRVDLAPIGRVKSITVGFMEQEEKEEEITPPGQMVTGDHNLVNVQASINYRIREADMENYVLQQDQVDAFVARAAESILAEWIAGRKVDDILRRGKHQLPIFLHDHLQNRLKDYSLGIEIEHASITKLDPPDEVKPAFDALAHKQTGIQTSVNKAKTQARQRIDETESKAFQIGERARTYQRVERLAALADADSFNRRVQQYRDFSAKDPDYINVVWLDAMTRLFVKMQEEGRVELLDHYLTNGGLNITQFPLQKKK